MQLTSNTSNTKPNFFCQLCFVFVTCVHRRAVLGMEGCGMSSTGVVYGEWDVLGVAATF